MAGKVSYGFVGLENMFAERVSDANVKIVRDAISQSVAEHNRQVQAIMSEMVEVTEAYTVRFKQPGGGTLQPLDEFGNPKPVRPGGYYDVAFPIQGGGTAWGDNRITRALMTVDEVNEYTLGALRKDADWMKRHIVAALIDNAEWTYEDLDKGNLVVKPLANGDTVEYLRKNGDSAVNNHYLAQAAAISDAANPFPAIHTELMEHPVNGAAKIIAYVPTALKESIMGLANFNEVRDTDIMAGSGSDTLTASLDRGFGDEVLGKVDKVWIVEWSMLPDTHMLAVARGSQETALCMREYPASELKGFFQEENSPDGNLKEHRFIRYAGFGTLNRVGALVQQIGSGTYSIPAGFDAPLSV